MFRDADDLQHFRSAREKMISQQLISRGIKDKRVLDAMREVPRHIFVHVPLASKAYEDHPVPIGENQTISQPYMVALMTEKLELTGAEKVLEIGTGSGYQTAILSRLAEKIYTIERMPKLYQKAKNILTERLGCRNVFIIEGDGTYGLPQFAPYDRIIITAGTPSFPDPLKKQLKEGGIAIMPIGEDRIQTLYSYHKKLGVLKENKICSCTFVPLIGKFGWKDEK